VVAVHSEGLLQYLPGRTGAVTETLTLNSASAARGWVMGSPEIKALSLYRLDGGFWIVHHKLSLLRKKFCWTLGNGGIIENFTTLYQMQQLFRDKRIWVITLVELEAELVACVVSGFCRIVDEISLLRYYAG